MPVTSAKQWHYMQWRAHGGAEGKGPSREVAEEFIHATPPEKRKSYAKALKGGKRSCGSKLRGS